jgi:acylglycerol lipase
MTELNYSEWLNANGIASYKWRAESPKGQVLLQHGLGEYSLRYVDQYSNLIPTLVGLGYDVYAFDLPGHGNSEGKRALIDLHKGIELHLRARELMAATQLPTVLYGHSLGGLITAGSIIRDGENIAAAVIGSSALHLPSQGWERAVAGLMGTVAPNSPIPLPRPGLEALSRDSKVVAKAALDPMFYQGKAKNLVAKTVLQVSDEVWSKAAGWQVPTLIMHGDKDTSTDHRASIKLYESIGARDKELAIYPGAFHELLNDLVKDEAAEKLIGWIQSKA